jgi:hypothetical protein
MRSRLRLPSLLEPRVLSRAGRFPPYLLTQGGRAKMGASFRRSSSAREEMAMKGQQRRRGMVQRWRLGLLRGGSPDSRGVAALRSLSCSW